MPRHLALIGIIGLALVRPPPSAGIGAIAVVTNLSFPAGFTFSPDGRIFYGERFTGAIRIYDPSSGSDSLFFTVPNLETSGEQGLLGLAVHPRYPLRPFVYAYVTRSVGGNPRNQIIRVTDDGGTGVSPRAIWTEDVVAATNHNGGRILFGPDRRLYAVVGEANDPANAQDLLVDAGKILRMTDRGGVPPDNPFAGSLVWSYGMRNSFGFSFDPPTGNLWETDNGPACNDEVNLIQVGANYGWGPTATCFEPPSPPENTNQDGPNPVLPLAWYTPNIAPVGNAFCFGCGLAGSEGTFFWGGWEDSQIRRVTLTPDRTGIASTQIVYVHPAPILSLERGPDRALYLSDPTGIWRLVQT
jgi:glucose/arabinose dehydrogenase